MNDILVVLSLIAGFLIYFISTKKYIHIVQLEGYKNKQFIHWLGKNLFTSVLEPIGIFLVMLILFFLGSSFFDQKLFVSVLALIVFIIISRIYLYPFIKKKFKKPLVFTHRLIRLLIVNILVIGLETLILPNVVEAKISSMDKFVLWFSFAMVLVPLNMILSNLIISPVEKAIHRYYINSAVKKISSIKNLIRIGITGSFGKTSTKFILSAILAEKYDVLVSPDSYNTTMGTTKVIREMLSNEHQVFISEMGARNIGDIAEICKIVRPNIGIITSIGKQHLETFKGIGNVIKTKYELMQGLNQGGVGFFPSDNKYCYELYKTTKINKILYGMEEHLDEVELTVKDLALSDKGSTFLLTSKDGESVKCTTKLLGKHNVLNILGCAAIARHLGLSMEEIASGISKVEPIPHRLQILPTHNGTVVIDDAFNSNPVGANMALEVLSQFHGRKIIITPGMVELGEEEYSLNKDFGRNMAHIVDIAILVGKKRTQAIQEGLKVEGFNPDNLIVVNSLDEGTAKLATIIRSSDVILFENDLPDNYDEK